jgi:PKD repeat protein
MPLAETHMTDNLRSARRSAALPTRWLMLAAPLVVVLTLAGCPPTNSTGNSNGVTANITLSATHGPAPLTITASAASSTSTNGAITKVLWDFAGEAQSDKTQDTHTFTHPGKYAVTLTVTDATGQQGSAIVDVRAEGGTAKAVIKVNVASGPAPLTVKFDGTTSSATDGDEILDYHWNFGDGATSGLPTPSHTFIAAGTYSVTLRVVSGGGAEDQTDTTISVGANHASLQFDGNQFATLRVLGTDARFAVTLEGWFKAAEAGGTLVSFGQPAIKIAVAPTQQKVELAIGDKVYDLAATNLSGLWHYVAVSYDGTAGATVYLDGQALNTTALAGAGDITTTDVTLGMGWNGKAAEIHLWSKARTAAELSGGVRLSGSEENLLGNWRIDEGNGQYLANTIPFGPAGLLGASTASEAADPAWSTDGPPLP